ncbi:MAG: hypothetical protein AB1611_00135 [bacterium]
MNSKTKTIIIVWSAIFLFLSHPQDARCLEGALGSFDVNTLGRAYAYFAANPRVGREEKNTSAETRIDLAYSQTLFRRLSFRLSSRFQADTDKRSEDAIDGLEDNGQHRRMFDLHEGFIEYRLGWFDFYCGRRILAWGKSDHFNPADRINPKDYTDFLDNEKMGVFLGGFKLSFTRNSQLEACYIPSFTRSRIYLSGSRWAAFDRDMQIEEEIPEIESYASRYSLYLKNLDIDMIYMRRAEDLPTLLLNPRPLHINSSDLFVAPGMMIAPAPRLAPAGFFGSGSAGLVEKYRKMNLMAIEWSTTVADRVELHGGATYHDMDRKEVYGRFVQYLLGLNYTFDGWFCKDVKVSSEYMNCAEIDKPVNEDLLILDFVRIFENSLFSRLSSTLTSSSSFEIGNLWSFEKTSNDILRLEYQYSPYDVLEFKLGLDFIWGNDESVFRQFEKNDRTWISIRYVF